MADAITDTPAEVGVSVILEGIGSRVREMRKAKGLTLADLAQATSLSTAIVSQIERGRANPSFSTLAQLAHGLNIPVGKLFADGAETKSPVVRREQRRQLSGGHGAEFSNHETLELLTPDLNRSIEAIWVVSPPGTSTRETPYTHSGEECGIVLSGRKDVFLNGEKYTLEEGDSITYKSNIPHWYENNYDETCISIWIITPPTW